MWNDFSSPGDENREPNSENGVYEAVLLGGSHSGNIIASKPCRRPVRPSHLFKSSPKKSPAYGADELSPRNHSSIGSNFVIQRSPLKTLNSNNSPLRSPQTSPPGKPVQRVSSILAQRQKFDLTGLNGTVLDMERLVTTPKKTPKGLDNRAVRIRINSSKVISGSSPMSGKGSQPSVSNKNSRYDMFPAEAAFSVQETRTTALSAFELIEQEGQKQDRKMNSSRVKNITPTVTPGPTVYNDNYHTSSGGVSLSRPSVQRSHSRQPSSNNSSNSKDSKLKKTPEKKITPQRKSYAAPRKLETELRPSPLKRKEALPYQDVKTMDTHKILNGPKPSVFCLSPSRARVTVSNITAPLSVNWREPKSFSQVFNSAEGGDEENSEMTDNNKNDMNGEEEEVSGVSISTPTIDAIKNLCMRSRAAAATIISSSGTIAYPRDTGLDTSTKINVHIGGKGLNSNIIVPQNTYGNESPNDESSKECSSSFDQQTTMDNLLSLEATLEHVSRVQIRTKNIVVREGPFSFPKTVGGFPRTLHTPKPAWSADPSPSTSPFSDTNFESNREREAENEEFKMLEEKFSDEKIINRKIQSRNLRSMDSGSGCRDGVGSSLYLSADSGITAFYPRNQDPQCLPSYNCPINPVVELRQQQDMKVEGSEILRRGEEETDDVADCCGNVKQEGRDIGRSITAPIGGVDAENVHGMSIRANKSEKAPNIPVGNLQAEIAWMSLQSPIEKINRGRSASYGTIRTPRDSLLYTPEASQPYVHHTNSMGNSDKKNSHDKLTESETVAVILDPIRGKNFIIDDNNIIDQASVVTYSPSQTMSSSVLNGIAVSQSEDLISEVRNSNIAAHEIRKSDNKESNMDEVLTQCLGLDELLWGGGSNVNSPCDAPVIPTALNFSNGVTPAKYIGYHSKHSQQSNDSNNVCDSDDSRNHGQYYCGLSDKDSTPINRGAGREGAATLPYTPMGFEYGRDMTPKPRPVSATINGNSEGRRPRSGSFSETKISTGSLSILGSAVRLTPLAAQLSEEDAAADALELMTNQRRNGYEREQGEGGSNSIQRSGNCSMQGSDCSMQGSVNVDGVYDSVQESQEQQPQLKSKVTEECGDDADENNELEGDESSLFALDYVRDDGQNDMYCDNDSASDRSQDKEISAVLANLLLEEKDMMKEGRGNSDCGTIFSSEVDHDSKMQRIIHDRMKENMLYELDEHRLIEEQKEKDEYKNYMGSSPDFNRSNPGENKITNTNANANDTYPLKSAKIMRDKDTYEENANKRQEISHSMIDLINVSNLNVSIPKKQGSLGEISTEIYQSNVLDVSTTEDLETDSSALHSTATTITIDLHGYGNFKDDLSTTSRLNKSITSKSMNSKSINNYQSQARSKLNNNDTRNSNSKKVSTPINPSLVITRKKRKKDAITEMKEIVLKALPGGSTSVALTLGNNRPGVIILKPKAILVRYEPSRPVQVNEQCGRDLNVGSVTAVKSLKDVINRSSFVEDAAIVNSAQKNGPLNDSRKREEKELELEINRRSIFTVTPDSLIIIPGSENVFQITFSPALSSSGVYSGALKINAGNKSFVMLLRGEVQDPPHNIHLSPLSTKNEFMQIEEENVGQKNGISYEDTVGKVDSKKDDIYEFVNIDSAEKNKRTISNEFNNENKTKEREQEYGAFACDNLSSAPSLYQSVQRTEIVQIESKTPTEDTSTYSPYVTSGSHQKLMNARETQQEKVRTWLDREKERTARGSLMYGLDNTSIGDILEKRNRELIPEHFLSNIKSSTNYVSRYTDSGTSTGAGASPYPNPYPYPSSSSLSSSCFAFPASTAVVVSTTSVTPTLAAPFQQPEQCHRQESQLTHTRQDSQGLTSPQRSQNIIHTSATSPISYFPSSLDMSAMGASTSGRIVGYNSHTYTHGVSWSEQQYALSDRAIMAALARKQADIEKYERNSKDNCNISYSDVSTQRGCFTMNTSRYDHPHSYNPCQPEELVYDLRESMVNLPKNQNVTFQQSIPSLENTAASSSSLAVRYGHQNIDRKPIPKSVVLSSSLYFRSQIANFGMTAVGCNSRLKLELCNSSSEEVMVYISDTALPFVVIHNEIKLRPKSFVKVSVRFVPISGPREYRTQLVAQTADGLHHTEVTLSGSSHWN